MNQLEHYEEIALTMDVSRLRYAIKDIKRTMDIWKSEPMSHPYNRQLWAQFDAYTVRYYNLLRESQ
jgi:hypothetical protein